MSGLPYLEVDTTADSQRFWEELGRGRITIPWCTTCDTWVWHPRPVCPRCLSAVDAERTLSGAGTVYSFSVVHRGAEGFDAPYVFSYVALEGGPTVLSNIVGAGCLSTAIGDPVQFAPPPTPMPIGALRFERVAQP